MRPFILLVYCVNVLSVCTLCVCVCICDDYQGQLFLSVCSFNHPALFWL